MFDFKKSFNQNMDEEYLEERIQEVLKNIVREKYENYDIDDIIRKNLYLYENEIDTGIYSVINDKIQTIIRNIFY